MLTRGLKFGKEGLIPVIIQDYKTHEVLMLAYMNRKALNLTRHTGLVHFYSRSRKKIWLKGETSGHVQKVKEILVDCDKDTLLIKVDQRGGACHMGYRSCFFRKFRQKEITLEVIGRKVFEPKEVYEG